MTLDHDAQDTLEALIDTYTLADVLTAISDICYGKAEHLRSNWQDENAARVWQNTARRVGSYKVVV